MATVTSADKRKYSWWWDSHISPKNSKWLQDNLTGMDSKVKQMIKLIEEDADSFARRAEMYYKKRPELMKLVEEFYRAYRALAERYDHATGVIHQAHKTMSEAFPNQDPFMLADESPSADSDPRTPEMFTGKRNGAFTDGSDFRKAMKKHLNDAKFSDGRVKKGLKFDDGENTEQNGNSDLKAQVLSESDRVGKAENEIQALKQALAKLEAEKEAGLLQYQQSMERLSNLESEFTRAQENSREQIDRASKAETEVQNLKEAQSKLEAERETCLVEYQQCLAKLSNMEKSFSLAQQDSESEAQALKQNLALVEAEKEATLIQYNQSLDKISNLQERLHAAEECAKRFKDQAEKAENELESLKQIIAKLMEENETAALQYQFCQETISHLERKLAAAEEEAKRLNLEIFNSNSKLRDFEEQCRLLEKSNETFQSEMESLVVKLKTQDQELTEKQKEMGRLWACMQEEHLRFVEAETAFQTLQHLHSQSQDELRSIAVELQNRTQILNEIEVRNKSLHDEVEIVKEENKSLNELNVSSAMSIENLEAEILTLRETIQKLETEVELRVDQRNALQQEIYCLKEELNDLIQKVKEIQDENSNLKNDSERDSIEKVALLAKLDAMNEKNATSEKSISDLTVQLETVRGKLMELEDSYESLLTEKSTLVTEKETLISQLLDANKTLEKLSAKNNFMQNSIFDVNAELEGLRVKSKSLEDSNILLLDENSILITERKSLNCQLEVSRKKIEDLENKYEQLQDEYSVLEKERESTLHKIEELKLSLDAEKQEHDNFVQQSGKQLANLELLIYNLQKEGEFKKQEHEEELDRAVSAQFEIFVLQKCIRDLQEKNYFILEDCQKLQEASNLSAELISELENEKLKQQVEVKSLFDQITILRIGLQRLLKIFEIKADHGGNDQVLLELILAKYVEMQNFLFKNQEDNQQLAIENSVFVTLLSQLKLELEAGLLKLHEELEKSKHREEILIRKLLKGRNEVELWESNATTLFVELQRSSVQGAVFEGKTRELAKVCENLNVDIGARDWENNQMKEKVDSLESENRRLKAELASFIPAVIPLRDCVTSLENHIQFQNKIMDEETKDFENRQPRNEDMISTTDRFSELQDLQMRIRSIEKAVMEMERLALIENLNANSKLDSAVRQLEEFKSGNFSRQKSQRKPIREISMDGNEVITKDIMLDQISESSSYGLSRRRTMEVDDQMLELWETTGREGNIDLKVGKSQKLAAVKTDYLENELIKGRRGKNPSIGSLVEKELRVDTELSRRFPEVVSKKNVLERLDSDAQKLENLQITVQDLKQKVEITEKAKKGKGIEYDSVKEQLEESEEAVAKLFDVNRKLIAKAEKSGSLSFDGKSGSLSFDGKSSEMLDSTENSRRRKISEQARRASEKIGRLQVEVQKLQFLLLKLDDENNKSKGKVRITDRKTKVILRDYLYGGATRTPLKKTKKHFCGCVPTPTKGDYSDHS
ncbi:hypothetical protein ACFE04_031912 [Oxalis oulophora]